MASGDVQVNLEPLRRFAATVTGDLRGVGNGPIRKAIKQWAVRYRAFVQERFDAFSKGGGDWPPLAASTIRRRRKGKKIRMTTMSGQSDRFQVRTASILRDTGTLFQALEPVFKHKPGALELRIPFGVRVGYGGPARHPGGKATIADIARFHQEGKGKLPKRRIIVDPPPHLVQLMAGDMERALAQANRRATGG